MKRKLKEKGRENEGGRKLRNENSGKIVKVKIRRESKKCVAQTFGYLLQNPRALCFGWWEKPCALSDWISTKLLIN